MQNPSFAAEIEKVLDEKPVVSVGYKWGGTPVVPTEDDCCAKSTEEAGQKPRFWVAYCTHGNDSGGMRNPSSAFYVPQNDRIGHLGKNRYEFREVTEESYSSYRLFLDTGNVVHLRQAERSSR